MEPTFRWVNGWEASDEDWARIENIFVSRGWLIPAKNTSRFLLVEREGELIGFQTLQAIPHCGPLFVAEDERGTGLAEHLCDGMQEYLTSVQIHGYLAIAESPFAVRLCEDRGMKRLESPVYIKMERA